MTARELIQKIIEECPDIDAEIYIQKPPDEIEMKDYEIEKLQMAVLMMLSLLKLKIGNL